MHTHIDTHTHRHTQTHTDTHRHTQTHTDTHRHTHTHMIYNLKHIKSGPVNDFLWVCIMRQFIPIPIYLPTYIHILSAFNDSSKEKGTHFCWKNEEEGKVTEAPNFCEDYILISSKPFHMISTHTHDMALSPDLNEPFQTWFTPFYYFLL